MNHIICIERQFGSGGRTIALGKKPFFKYHDNISISNYEQPSGNVIEKGKKEYGIFIGKADPESE